MPDPYVAVVAVALGYFLGAIPFALLLGHIVGVDLRTSGTGNVGAGNLTRLAGLHMGAPAAVLDGLKGLAAVMLAERLGLADGIVAASAVAAVAGHNWSIYLRSRAGRGLATAVGALVGLAPTLLIWTGLWGALGWWIGGGFGGFVGWGLLGVVAVITGQSPGTVTAATALSLVVLVRRMQGNPGAPTDGRSRLRRVVWDTDRVSVDESPVTERALS